MTQKRREGKGRLLPATRLAQGRDGFFEAADVKHDGLLWGANGLDAWEATMTGPGCDLSQERVDSTSNPEARTTALIITQARFADMRANMPKESRAVVEHVVLNGKYLRCGLARDGHEMAVMLEQLRIALDVLADYLGLR